MLALTMLEDDSTILAAVQAGARGYLLKEATPDEIVRAVEGVAAGQVVFGGTAADRVLASLGERNWAVRAFPDLTDREAEVLGLMAQGLTNAALTSPPRCSGGSVTRTSRCHTWDVE